LNLLKFLRIIILQDAYYIRQINPQHPILQDRIFQTPEYLAFYEQQTQRLPNVDEIADATIQQAIPRVAERLL